MRRPELLLLVLLPLAAWARLADLARNPPGLFCDEAAIAVNARRLALTGSTLSGARWPLYCPEPSFSHWRSKGIVYQPVFFYTTLPFVRLLGLDPLAVRLPAVLFGVLGIVTTFVLGREIVGAPAAMAAATFLALSPSHHHVSRMGMEPISVLPFVTLGFALLWRGGGRLVLRSAHGGGIFGAEAPGSQGATRAHIGDMQPRSNAASRDASASIYPQDGRISALVPGAALLGLATYAYPPARLFVPLLLAAFVWVRWRDLKATPRSSAAAALVLALVVLPNLVALARGVGSERLPTLLITQANVRGELAVQELRRLADTSPVAGRLLESHPLLVGYLFVRNVVRYFSPSYLWLSGDPKPLVHPPGRGVMLAWLAPWTVAGVVYAARRLREARFRFLLAWLVIAPLPASLTTQNPHALRALLLLPALALVAGLGCVRLWAAARSRVPGVALVAWLLILPVAIGLPLEYAGFLAEYRYVYPSEGAPYWQAGIGQALRLAGAARGSGTVYLSHEIHGANLFVLFYAGVDLAKLSTAQTMNEQLAPYGYQCVLPDGVYPRRKEDVWIISDSERKRHRDAAIVGEVPYPDGRPNLLLIRHR